MKANVTRRTFLAPLFRGDQDEWKDQVVPSRDPNQEMDLPSGTYAFVFYDRDVVELVREEADGQGPTEVATESYNLSPVFVRLGRVLTKDAESPKERMLVAQLEMATQGTEKKVNVAMVSDPDSGQLIGALAFSEPVEVLRTTTAEEEAQASRQRRTRLLFQLGGNGDDSCGDPSCLFCASGAGTGDHGASGMADMLGTGAESGGGGMAAALGRLFARYASRSSRSDQPGQPGRTPAADDTV